MPALKKIEWKSVYSLHEQSQIPLCGDRKNADIAAPPQTQSFPLRSKLYHHNNCSLFILHKCVPCYLITSPPKKLNKKLHKSLCTCICKLYDAITSKAWLIII